MSFFTGTGSMFKTRDNISSFLTPYTSPPPARTSKSQDELKSKPKQKKRFLQQRDRTIKEIRKYKDFDEGLKRWKIQSGYHRRSLIESFMFRLKKAFGFNLQHKTDRARKNEIIIKINLLNQMVSYVKLNILYSL